jgi:hypothetical protein
LFDPGIAQITESRLARITESHFDYEVDETSTPSDASEAVAVKLGLRQSSDRTYEL